MGGRLDRGEKAFFKEEKLISLKFFEVVARSAAVAILFVNFVDLLFIFPSEQL